MLRLIKEPQRIIRLEKAFSRQRRATTAAEMHHIKVGWHGGNYDEESYHSPNLDFWWVIDSLPKRTWNLFGIRKPLAYPSSNSIVCEINFAFKGISRRVSGAFAEDAQGNIFVTHRGRIGGGRKGIGKERFWNEFPGVTINVSDDGFVEEVALVGALNGNGLARQVSDFVHSVKAIKENRSSSGSNDIPLTVDFTPEFAGRKEYELTVDKVTAEADHGRVVNTLRNVIRDAGFTVGNTRPIDLFVTDQNGKVDVLLEVKTDPETTSVYGAIGQLMYHSSGLSPRPILIAVFPDDIPNKIIDAMNRLGIKVLRYRWIQDKVSFNKNEIVFLLQR